MLNTANRWMIRAAICFSILFSMGYTYKAASNLHKAEKIRSQIESFLVEKEYPYIRIADKGSAK